VPKKPSKDETPSVAPHGEQRSGPVAGTAFVDGATFSRKPLLYANVEGQAIFEGDIVLGSVQAMQDTEKQAVPQRAVGITGQQYRWPNATIPYEIDSGLPNQQRVTDAIAHWEAKTHIRFVQRTAANQSQYPDYVRFVSGGGCSSMVGKQGGRQDITLGSGCTSGNAIHEIGHTVGLWHEQSREDRDTFVEIVWANIDPSMQYNFSQHIQDGDDLGAYDYGSIMHYPRNAFTINGQDTIVPRQTVPPGVVVGQRTGLSAGDIAGVQTMYPQATIKEVPKDPIQDTIKEVRKDPIQDTTIKEIRKDPIQDTIKEARKDPIRDTLKEVGKDPIQDTTVKEIRKDPIQDTTIKEIGKDPIADPTIKEGSFDPGPGGPGPGPGPLTPGLASPFVLATPSRAGGAGGAGDALTEAAAQVEQLAQAIDQLQQQLAALIAAYEQAVQTLEALQQGQGLA
jgi:hypothetical protein